MDQEPDFRQQEEAEEALYHDCISVIKKMQHAGMTFQDCKLMCFMCGITAEEVGLVDVSINPWPGRTILKSVQIKTLT